MKQRFLYVAPVIFSAFGAIAILWRMLLPGYILTLDLMFGPHPVFPGHLGLSAVTFPSSYILYLLELVLSGWVVEKIMLFAIFFLLFYLPLKFYPFENKYGERYFVATFYAMNPFVYERLLAGQWKVLLGYAFLFPFVSCLIRFYRDPSWGTAFFLYLSLLAISFSSLHLLVMGSIILAIYFLFTLITVRLSALKPMVKELIGGGFLFFLVSMYWIVPYVVSWQTAKITVFSSADWQAFRTAGAAHIGTIGNVLALYGFWGEHEPWVQQFVLPSTHTVLWIIMGISLAAILLIGWARGLQGGDRKDRRMVVFLSVMGVLAALFSAGVGSRVSAPINWWLFDHVWFWRGFRDTQKWSAVLALVYALIAGSGVSYLASKINRQWLRNAAIAGLCLIAVLYTYKMAFGFGDQLKPAMYPASWAEVNTAMEQSGNGSGNGNNCNALFLPWHEYYSLVFAGNILTANPATSYFNCTIITSQAVELGDISDVAGTTPTYNQIQAAITDNAANPDQTIRFLESKGIQYVIYTNDVAYEDPYTYPFLTSDLVQKVVSGQGIDLFKLR